MYHDDHHAVSVGATLFFNRVSHGVFANTTFEQAFRSTMATSVKATNLRRHWALHTARTNNSILWM
nr:hypothetical protein [Enterovibrio coralii]